MAIYKNTPPIVTNGLVLHLDAGSRQSYVSGSTTWTDLSGNKNSGTLTNGPTFNSVNQGSIVFDGTNDVVTGSLPSGISGTQTCTQGCWFKRTTISSFSAFVGFGTNSSTANRFVIQVWNDGIIYLAFDTAAWGNFTSNDTNWHNIQVVFNGTLTGNSNRLKVYFDGVETALSFTGTIPTSVGTPTGGYRVGQTFTDINSYGSSSIASVQIYNRALSAQEVNQNYNALKSRFGLT